MRYSRVATAEEALAALARPGARAYAGGTDLLVALHAGSPGTDSVDELVDIKGIAAAAGMREEGGLLRIGALVTAAELEGDPTVSRLAGAVADAARQTGAPLIRARGTIGGNVSSPHPAPDVATALLALDAAVRVALAPQEVGTVSLEELLGRSPVDAGSGPRPPALILAVEIDRGSGSAFRKLGSRRAFSRARVSAAVSVRDGAHRVAVAGLTARPAIASATATALDEGRDLADAVARDLAAAGAGDLAESARATRLARLIGSLAATAADRATRGERPE